LNVLPVLPLSTVLTKLHDDSWAACMSTTSVMLYLPHFSKTNVRKIIV